MAVDEDDTIRLTPGAQPPGQVFPTPPLPSRAQPKTTPRRTVLWAGAAALAVLAASGAGWWGWQAGLPRDPATRSATAPAAAPPPPAASDAPVPGTPPGIIPASLPALPRLSTLPPLLDEAGLLEHRATEPRLLRLADNPAVFVIDFPNLDWQGAALNRVAALIEKAGLPRDRVLTQEELAAAIARSGDTPATFYYGHNYRGVSLDRFFRTAARDGIALSAEEAWVEAQYRLARSLVPEGQEIAILSVAAPDGRIDLEARATILRHELGHGLFATRPAYADHIRRVWRERFTEAERAAFRAFLAREDYDTSNEEMMIDEAQAYLLHTPNPRFFSPRHVGMDEAGVARLRALMREGAPYLPMR